MTLHNAPHPLAGQTVKLDLVAKGGEPSPTPLFRVEDWADRIFGQPWGLMRGNPGAMKYAMRWGLAGKPADDDVVYGKDERGLGHLVHVSELVTPTTGGDVR